MSSQRRKGCPYLNAKQARSSLPCLSGSRAASGVVAPNAAAMKAAMTDARRYPGRDTRRMGTANRGLCESHAAPEPLGAPTGSGPGGPAAGQNGVICARLVSLVSGRSC